MVYISLRMEHLTAGQVQGRIEHNERIVTRKDKDGTLGPYVGKHEQINPDKTTLNYSHPINKEYRYMSTYMKQKRDELEDHKQENPDDEEIQKRRMIGKNRNIAIEFVIQLGHTESGERNCPEEDMNSFLHHAFKELKNKFPGQEILNMTIHQDELTPHMHVIMSHWNTKKKKWNQKGNFSNGKTFRYYQDWIGEVGKAFQKEKELDYDIKRGETKESTKAVHQPHLHPNQIKQIESNLYAELSEHDYQLSENYQKLLKEDALQKYNEDKLSDSFDNDDLVMSLIYAYYDNNEDKKNSLPEKLNEEIIELEKNIFEQIRLNLEAFYNEKIRKAHRNSQEEVDRWGFSRWYLEKQLENRSDWKPRHDDLELR